MTRDAWWTALPATAIILALDADEAAQQRWEALAAAAAQAGKRVLTLKAAHLRPSKDLSERWATTGALPAALHRLIQEAHLC